MKKVVWKNKSNGQLCITIPRGSDIQEGDTVDIKKASIKKIAYSGVVADLFHYGHLQSIQFAKSLSDYNIVGVMTDNAVEEYRAKPIANLRERMAIISSLNCVDRVMIQNTRDHTENLKKIHKEFPNAEIMLVHGSDLKQVPGSEYIKKIGGRLVQHPYYKRLSTFKIISNIAENRDKFKDISDFASLIKGENKIDSEHEKGNKTIVSSKADTLKALKPLLKSSKIEDMLAFTVSDWKNKKQEILRKIKEKFSPNKVVVRSSAVNEDTAESSMAGYFESVLDVCIDDINKVESAIKKVINSYSDKKSESSFNQVLVQTQTKNIVMSGVVFTRTLESNAPYYVINYDDSTGETDTVTKGVENKTIKISRFAKTEDIPKGLQKLLISVKEIESLIPKIGLDIEFAINQQGEIMIFQVRPLTTSTKYKTDDEQVKEKLDLLKNKFKDLSKKKAHLAGENNIFADMPDWNPAEIIGDNPNHLDYSLYDYIITDSAWHEARTSQGYYNVIPAKLVVQFGNKPYVDVRNTFNSFVPNSLSQNLREKLVNFYLNKLRKNPEMQDKVEFEIVYNCYDPGFHERAKELLQAGFSKEEVEQLRKALVSLTNNLVLGSKESIPEDLNTVKNMEKSREKIVQQSKSKETSVASLLKNAKFLLDDCREKGTVQFSRLARLGFIGKILLKSLVSQKVISQEFYDSFMNSISTVAKDINKDFILLSTGKMNKDEFIRKYYHLRPGSYDITSPRYESNINLLENMNLENLNEEHTVNFITDKKTKGKISDALKKEGLKFDAEQLLSFVKKSLESREFSKFEFSKNLSEALELIASAGEKMGFTRQELAMLDISEIFSAPSKDQDKLTESWKGIISKRTNEREVSKKISLPPIIFSEKDFDIIHHYIPRPNFITQKSVKGKIVNLSRVDKETVPDVEDKVVLIESGDPGYDWIFTRSIAGLITKYGGVASHMSIRCAEFGIPAAIGSGILFDQVSNADSVLLDCGSKRIIPMRGE